ncbi:YeeE/YedE family protein [Kangiella japonica]|uniref:YeeE/YedE family protein n=1 Tax=Kangiella japonica TaxID=647384 RepID=A0ABN0SZZ3_9GAMM
MKNTATRKMIIALFCGTLFGFGLAMSQMINPDKVQGFLDIFGEWDPTLAWVMGGALLVSIPGFSLLLTKEERAQIKQGVIDSKLLIGSALFGIGWGLSGYCPGPAISVSPLIIAELMWFLVPLVTGMIIARLMLRKE